MHLQQQQQQRLLLLSQLPSCLRGAGSSQQLHRCRWCLLLLLLGRCQDS
jgi:hypothetical protein